MIGDDEAAKHASGSPIAHAIAFVTLFQQLRRERLRQISSVSLLLLFLVLWLNPPEIKFLTLFVI